MEGYANCRDVFRSCLNLVLLGAFFVRPLCAETVDIDQQMRSDMEGVVSILQEVQSLDDLSQANVKLPRHAAEARSRWQKAQIKSEQGSAEEAYQASKQLADEMKERIFAEVGRIRSLEGMTAARWNAFESARTRAISDIMSAMQDALNRRGRGTPAVPGPRSSPPSDAQAAQDTRPTGPMLNVIIHGDFEITITDNGVYEALKEIYPTRLAYYETSSDGPTSHRMKLSPATDAEVLAKKIKFAKVLKIDSQSSTIEIELTGDQMKAISQRAEDSLGKAEVARRRKFLKGMDDDGGRFQEFDARVASDPKHPNFFAENLKRLRSGDHFEIESAVQQLRHTKPAECADEATRSAIGETLLRLLDDDQLSDEALAYRVVLTWAGKQGSLALIERLKQVESPHEARELILAFSKVRSKSAALVIAPHLANFFTHEEATKTLRSMGSAAEPALLEAAEKLEPEAAAIAVQLLAEVGTRNSLPFLRRALKSKNAAAREISRQTIAAIEKRHPASGENGEEPNEERTSEDKKSPAIKRPKKSASARKADAVESDDPSEESQNRESSEVLDLPAVRRASDKR